MTRSHAMVCALVLVATGCQLDDPLAGPSLVAAIQAARARMHTRFESARDIEQSIARGDLDRARQQAHVLSGLAEPDALPRWRPYLDRIGTAALQIERAADVVGAARATAALGRECARCHEAMATKIAFSLEPRPPDDRKLQPQMLGHQWAVARLWEGLIGPSNDRWAEGAGALMQARLTIVAEQATAGGLRDWVQPGGDSIGDDVARVRLYAHRALAPHDQDTRAEIFGDLLATCAHCHAAIRDR